MERIIFHVDIDAFFCSVEEKLNPSLIGKPFAVGGDPNKRGVISSCSYAARKYGIHSAMPTGIALQKLPALLLISGNYETYSYYSKKVLEILQNYSGLIEQVSIDEAFLDVSDLKSSYIETASQLQSEIDNKVGLSTSIGIGTNKLVAKIANDFGKRSFIGESCPHSITVVKPGEEAKFLSSLPINYLIGVGPKTEKRFIDLGINCIGDLANFPEPELIRVFGKYGRELQYKALGIDNDPVNPIHELKSISHEITFSKDISDMILITDTINKLSEKVAKRLRKIKALANTVFIKIRFSNFSTITKQVKIKIPIDQDKQLSEIAIILFKGAWKNNLPIRLIGVGATNFSKAALQLELWQNPNQVRRNKLTKTLDDLEIRYGKNVVQKASDLLSKN